MGDCRSFCRNLGQNLVCFSRLAHVPHARTAIKIVVFSPAPRATEKSRHAFSPFILCRPPSTRASAPCVAAPTAVRWNWNAQQGCHSRRAGVWLKRFRPTCWNVSRHRCATRPVCVRGAAHRWTPRLHADVRTQATPAGPAGHSSFWIHSSTCATATSGVPAWSAVTTRYWLWGWAGALFQA